MRHETENDEPMGRRNVALRAAYCPHNFNLPTIDPVSFAL